jgi:hypothetical protein
MRRILALSFLLVVVLVCWVVALAQQPINTIVTGTITGPNGIPWANGTGSASLVCTGNAQPYIGSSPLPRSAPTVGLDGTGSFTQTLYNTALMVDTNNNPVTCNYKFSFNDQCGIAGFTTGSLTGVVGAGPVSLTSQISTYAVNVSPQCQGITLTATAPITISANNIACPLCNTALNTSYPANEFYASPSGTAGLGTFRPLASADFPTGLVPVNSVTPGTNGQCAITSGTGATWGSCAGTAGVQFIAADTAIHFVSASTTSVQTLPLTCNPCFAAGTLNQIGKTFEYESTGQANFSSTGTGLVIILNLAGNQFLNNQQFSVPALFSAFWDLRVTCTVIATGASGGFQCGGVLMWQTQTTPNPLPFIIQTFFPSSPNVNLTSGISVGMAAQFTTASTSNLFEQTYAVIRQDN